MKTSISLEKSQLRMISLENQRTLLNAGEINISLEKGYV